MKILLFGIDKKYAQEKFKLKSLITNKNMFMNKNKDIYYITDNEGDLIGQRFDIIIDYRPIELLSRLNEINLQNYHIGDNYFICEKQTFELEQELAELKEKAIVPRFKKGDTAYAIIDTTFYTDIFKVNVLDTELCYRVDRGNNDISTQHHTRLFATEQEAQAKLKEIQGNE